VTERKLPPRQWHGMGIIVDLSYRRGHVSVELNGTTYSLFHDRHMRYPIPGKTPDRELEPLWGGFRGEFKIRSETEVCSLYRGRLELESTKAVMGGESGKFVAKAPPNKYVIPADKDCMKPVIDKLEKDMEEPPEYHVLSKGGARNCVTYAVDLMEMAGLFEECERFPDNVISPEQFNDAMKVFVGSLPGAKHFILSVDKDGRFGFQECLQDGVMQDGSD